jgi:phosphopantetheinyl transferase (holo-ACP synthase)
LSTLPFHTIDSDTIGCDIVDLRPINPPLHKRFFERTYTADEIGLIGSDNVMLWRLWAAKEAAFKAAYRQRPGLVFSPKQFEFKPDSCVYYQNLRFPCHFIEGAEYIFAYCLKSSGQNNSNNVFNWIEDIKELNSTPQIEVRRLCREKISEVLGLNKDQIDISESGSKNGPATVSISGSAKTVLVSFSHDGRYIACSAVSLSA